MYGYKVIKSFPQYILLFSLIIIGEVLASPEPPPETRNTNERIEYTRSLNSIASTIMKWYGSLLSINDMQSRNQGNKSVNFIISPDNQLWEDHRPTYPEQITSIKIADADLTKQEIPGKYQFEVKLLMTFIQSNNPRSKLINEVLLFQISDSNKPEVKKIKRVSARQEDYDDSGLNSAFQHTYYKSREIAYAWLAYLDGAHSMGSIINIDHWADTVNYSLKIGSFELNEKFMSSLQKRNSHMGKGGHLLRSVNTKVLEHKPNHFELNLIIDWKGTAPDGKPALAKINQLIQYQITDDGSLVILAIKEKHLLPDMQPWQKLLC